METVEKCRSLLRIMVSLSRYWSDFFGYRKNPLYIHRDDLPFFGEKYWKRKPRYARERLDFKGFIKSERLHPNDSFFHFSLLPVPYVGNLAKADIFILLLNPGFSPGDYFGEYERRDFRHALVQNLKQPSGVESRFLYLDPRFCWHPGYRWWEAKLRKILLAVAKAKHNRNYLLALKEASLRIASIELVPYHSRTFRDGPLAERLKSAQAARAWVNDYLVPRAQKGKIVIVATYKWSLKNHLKCVVCVKKSAARGFPLTPRTKAGKLILEQLLKKRS